VPLELSNGCPRRCFLNSIPVGVSTTVYDALWGPKTEINLLVYILYTFMCWAVHTKVNKVTV